MDRLLSPDMDAMELLYSSELYQELKDKFSILDNISSCKILLDNPCVRLEKKRTLGSKSMKRTRTAERQDFLEQIIERNRDKLSIVAKINQKLHGPFDLLKNNQNRIVRCFCRGFNGKIRVYEGILIAYDKHLNVILKDCTETFQEQTCELISIRYDKRNRTKVCKSITDCTIFHLMLFIRGEFLILISAK